jgi:hypothetical protein
MYVDTRVIIIGRNKERRRNSFCARHKTTAIFISVIIYRTQQSSVIIISGFLSPMIHDDTLRPNGFHLTIRYVRQKRFSPEFNIGTFRSLNTSLYNIIWILFDHSRRINRQRVPLFFVIIVVGTLIMYEL